MEQFSCKRKHASCYWAVLLVAVLLTAMAAPVIGASIRVFVDGQEIDYGDSPPTVINERTMVGVRSLALALGVPDEGIGWDGPSQTVTLVKGNTVITLVMGSAVMDVNNDSVVMDTTPVTRNDRIYLPARYVSEALGYSVSWDQPSSSVLISSSGTPAVNNPETPNTPETPDVNNLENNNPGPSALSSDAAILIGSWSGLAYAPTGSYVDPYSGFMQGSYYSGDWYDFNADGTFRYLIFGNYSNISGMSESRGNFQVQGDQLLLYNITEDWTPSPNGTTHPAEQDQPADDETHTWTYNSQYDTLNIDGCWTYDRIK